MKNIKYFFSTENSLWTEEKVSNAKYEDTLELTDERKQTIKGFGGCFNEAGWDVLRDLKEEDRKNILDDLFDQNKCAFNVCRLPIGANDYALEWYSYDETPGDYELKDFSIKRDREYIVIVGNAMDIDREFTFKYKETQFSTNIKAHSINTFCVEA